MPTQERLVGTYLTSFDATSNRHLGLPLLGIIGDAAFALLPSTEHTPLPRRTEDKSKGDGGMPLLCVPRRVKHPVPG